MVAVAGVDSGSDVHVVDSAAKGVSAGDRRAPGRSIDDIGLVHEVAEGHAVGHAGIGSENACQGRTRLGVGVAIDFTWGAANLGAGRTAMSAVLAGGGGRVGK